MSSILYMNRTRAPDDHVIRIDNRETTTQAEEAARATTTTEEESRIRTLLRIRRLPPDEFWSVAEQEWEKDVNTSIGFMERRQARLNSLTNEIYQLVGFSAAFQGLLLTAVSQASRLSCKTKWWVLVLSMFATVVTAAGVRGKTKGVSRVEDAMRQEMPHKKSIMRMLCDLRQNGPEGFDFCREEQQRERLLKVPNEVTCFQKLVQIVSAECSYNSKIFYCLIIFGVLCVLSMRNILCD